MHFGAQNPSGIADCVKSLPVCRVEEPKKSETQVLPGSSIYYKK
jgi:hypothetical protein